MRSELIRKTLIDLKKINRNVALEGSPGGGKTSIVYDAATDMPGNDGIKGIPVVCKHMPTMLVEDFGILYPKGDGVEVNVLSYKLPDWYPYKGKPGTERGGVLLFDDRNQAGADLQKVLANIQQARELHGYALADDWMVVSTGNRKEDKAGANAVLTHLRNRETVFEYETNLDDWSDWANTHGVKSEVVSFMRWRPNLLHNFNPQEPQSPTPRSWVEGVSDVLGIIDPAAEMEAFTGAVGKGAAAEFVGFLRIYRDLPDPDLIMMNPETAEVPTNPAVLYALCGALAERVTQASFGNLVTYVSRMKPEFSVLAVRTAAKRDRSLAMTQAFATWTRKHQSVMY